MEKSNKSINFNHNKFEYTKKGKLLEIVTQIFVIGFIFCCGFYLANVINFKSYETYLILFLTCVAAFYSGFKAIRKIKSYKKLELKKNEENDLLYNSKYLILVSEAKLILVNYYDTIGSGGMSFQIYIYADRKYYLIDFGLKKEEAIELLKCIKEFTGIETIIEFDKTFFSSKIKYLI